jgi:Tol biopolymer transport system component
MKKQGTLAVLMVLLSLVSGCGTDAADIPLSATDSSPRPTASPEPPTATEAENLTATKRPMPAATSTLPEPSVTPDLLFDGRESGLIAFASNRDGDWDIYSINVDSGSLQQLTENDADDISPSWSPDGTQIALVSNRDGNDEIYVMNADGSKQRRMTETDASESFPAWSPDGTEISFDSDRDGNWEIYVMEADGGAPRRLTNNPADDWITSWSPDGSQLAFESRRDGNYEIYAMTVPKGTDTGGGDIQRLTDNRAHDGFPSWSPDGAQIAFMSQRDGNYDIYVMHADGTNQRRLTDDRAQDSDPAWSPDGAWLTFVSQRDGNDEIYIVRADGSLEQRLTTNTSLEWGPAWRPASPGVKAEPTASSDQPSPETRTRPTDGMIMVYVPGGTFLMGSTGAQIDVARALCDEYPDDYGKCKQAPFEDESPQHAVTLEGFWLDRTEMTNAQYALCAAEGACRASRLASNPAYNGDDYPVAGIPWQDAVDYCMWAGGRLPTEAEWEYAARGTEGTIFPWGDEFDCAGGNFWDSGTGCDDGYPEPAPVGSFPVGTSWCGAMDLAGNVWEWVDDAYGRYPAETQVNPSDADSGGERILRGGSWGYLPAFSRAAYRYPVPPAADYLAVGFRCAASAGD